MDLNSIDISIHAPRVGCDHIFVDNVVLIIIFQSTHPGWGATRPTLGETKMIVHFNPRTPGGVRHIFVDNVVLIIIFQSTHPGWGATRPTLGETKMIVHFNPRTPGGVRRIHTT